MPKYRRKPEEVKAVQWTGENREEVEALDPEHVTYYAYTNSFLIDTPDTTSGCEQVPLGFYVVQTEAGTLHRWADEDFYQTFEPVEG